MEIDSWGHKVRAGRLGGQRGSIHSETEPLSPRENVGLAGGPTDISVNARSRTQGFWSLYLARCPVHQLPTFRANPPTTQAVPGA